VTGDAYAVLVQLAERERALVEDGRVEELAALAAERDALVATLPPQAPPAARPALERALTLQTATAAALRASLAEMRHSIAALDRGRGVARAYAGPAVAAAPAASIDAAA
jgi:hypothetical protein